MTNFCNLYLTCADKKEADKIARALLKKRLVACVHKVPITSDFLWQGEAQYDSAEPSIALAKEGKIKSSKEVLLQMDSREDLFDQVEREVTKLHSYGTFVLEATSVTKISKKAQQWLHKELKNV